MIEQLQSIGVAHGISAKEVLRRAVEREMLAEDEACGTVIVRSADDCFDCHARNPEVFFTSKVGME